MVERRKYHAVIDQMRRLSCGIVVNMGREVASDLDLSLSLVM